MTTITQTFNYVWPEGTTPITFPDWIKTLTQEEQDEFSLARDRNFALRQQVVDAGSLEVQTEPDAYVWKDQAAFDAYKRTDPIWTSYFDRWIRETGVELSSIMS